MDFNALFGDDKLTPTAQKKEFAPVPTGTYMAEIVLAQVDLTKQPAQVAIRYKIKTEGDQMGRLLFTNFQLTEKGAPILRKELMKLGLNEKPKSMDHLSEMLSSITNKNVEVFAKQRTYVGRDGETKTAHNVYINAKAEGALPPEPNFDEPLTF